MEYIIYVDSDNRDRSLYPNSNAFTVFLTTPIKNITKVEVMSAMLPNVFSSQYLTLDIAELRTPRTLIADALTSNLVTSSNAYNGTFAHIPVKSSGGAAALITSNTVSYTANSIAVNTEFFNANYKISIEYPSRIDSLDRLTVTWRQPNNGEVFIDKTFTPSVDMGRNFFLLKLETVVTPVNPDDRAKSLPPVVPWESGEIEKMYIMIAIVAFSFFIILLSRRNMTQ